MGQYHVTVNLDKHEFIHPHKLGNGLKLREQIGSAYGIVHALGILLACSNGRGGGDISEVPGSDEIVGRWAGDRIATVGDYATDGDLADEHHAGSIYLRCYDDGDFQEAFEHYLGNYQEYDRDKPVAEPRFRDISDLVLPVMAQVCEVELAKDEGWRSFDPVYHGGPVSCALPIPTLAKLLNAAANRRTNLAYDGTNMEAWRMMMDTKHAWHLPENRALLNKKALELYEQACKYFGRPHRIAPDMVIQSTGVGSPPVVITDPKP